MEFYITQCIAGFIAFDENRSGFKSHKDRGK